MTEDNGMNRVAQYAKLQMEDLIKQGAASQSFPSSCWLAPAVGLYLPDLESLPEGVHRGYYILRVGSCPTRRVALIDSDNVGSMLYGICSTEPFLIVQVEVWKLPIPDDNLKHVTIEFGQGINVSRRLVDNVWTAEMPRLSISRPRYFTNDNGGRARWASVASVADALGMDWPEVLERYLEMADEKLARRADASPRYKADPDWRDRHILLTRALMIISQAGDALPLLLDKGLYMYRELEEDLSSGPSIRKVRRENCPSCLPEHVLLPAGLIENILYLHHFGYQART